VAATTRDVTYAYLAGHREQAGTIGARTYEYDRNGNQRAEKGEGRPTRLFDWDEEDRLQAVSDGGVTTAEFVYDAGGTRTHKAGASGTTVYASAYVTVRDGVEVTRHVYGLSVSGAAREFGGERRERRARVLDARGSPGEHAVHDERERRGARALRAPSVRRELGGAERWE
jgi:hypothetical protein